MRTKNVELFEMSKYWTKLSLICNVFVIDLFNIKTYKYLLVHGAMTGPCVDSGFQSPFKAGTQITDDKCMSHSVNFDKHIIETTLVHRILFSYDFEHNIESVSLICL